MHPSLVLTKLCDCIYECVCPWEKGEKCRHLEVFLSFPNKSVWATNSHKPTLCTLYTALRLCRRQCTAVQVQITELDPYRKYTEWTAPYGYSPNSNRVDKPHITNIHSLSHTHKSLYCYSHEDSPLTIFVLFPQHQNEPCYVQQS